MTYATMHVESSKGSPPQSRVSSSAGDQVRAIGLGGSDIVRRLPDGRPGASSVYRLEQGLGIRITNARRVFDVVNAALNNTLDAGKELKVK